jgi:phosphopantothenoylcysteine decarboxylase/phosphopantothenate--cysteine ligase
MWAHPATQRNVQTLRGDGRVTLVGPVVGPVANGEVGLGRMAEPADIVEAAMAQVAIRDLLDRCIVVTAGPTIEDLDPVRFVSNRSSGRMGFAIAQRAAARGARVVLVAGPVELATPFGVERLNVRSALEMREALARVMPTADALVMAAAVADYRAAHPANNKLKRSSGVMSLEMVPNPDLLQELGGTRQTNHPVLVGFALETASGDELAKLALSKLERKQVDLIVANNASDALGGDSTRAMIVSDSEVESLEPMTKVALANRILDRVARRWKTGH